MKTFFLLLPFLFSGCNKNSDPAETIPKISIEDNSTPEGTGTQTDLQFRVYLDHASSKTVEFRYSTVDGSAKGGEDFIASTSQLISLAPGETEKRIVIKIVADEYREGDEQFSIVITDLVNGNAGRTTGQITLINDDTKVPFTNAGYDAPGSYSGYTLAWSDEFNTTGLNSSIWTNQNGDGCPNLCGWGNNELEYYTDRPENIFFQDGKLIIEARKENYSGKTYTSSKILTSGKKSFKFGRIDIRAKLPKGKGIWPAFWLLPQNNVYGGWPSSGEIDLMEMIGHEAGRVYGTIHYGPGPGSIQISRNYNLPSGIIFNDEFHVFSLEWKQDQLKWFVDGNLYSTVNKSDLGASNYPFNENFFLIFNLAVGGNWPGNPDASTYFPQWLIVDYVRLYQ